MDGIGCSAWKASGTKATEGVLPLLWGSGGLLAATLSSSPHVWPPSLHLCAFMLSTCARGWARVWEPYGAWCKVVRALQW